MIYTSCGHNQYDFREVYTTRVDPIKWVHLCRKCYERESQKLFKEIKHEREAA